MLPTRSASGSLVVAGVEGGGHALAVGRFGVLAAFAASLIILDVFGVSIPFVVLLFNAAGRFSFSAWRSSVVSRVGAPSMNWKAFSLVRVCVDGIIGGPVTTCRVGAALLEWWGKGGPVR